MGGGLFCFGANATLTNCTVAGNRATTYSIGGIMCNSVKLYNTIVAGNYGVNLQGTVQGSHNLIDSDPGFVVKPVFFDDPEASPTERGKITNVDQVDLRLAADSKAIDGGDNNHVLTEFDFDGNDRVINEVVDIGAYEYAPEMISNGDRAVHRRRFAFDDEL